MAERDEYRINGRVLHESMPHGTSACSLHLTGRTLAARLPSGEVMKMDLRDAELRRGGSECIFDSTLTNGPTFVVEDADLGGAARLAWTRARVTRPVGSRGPGLPRAQKVALEILGAAVVLILIAVLMVGPLVRVTLRLVPRMVDGRVGEEAYPQVLRQVGFGAGAIEQSNIREPVQAVLDRLTAAVPQNPFLFRVTVCRSPIVNAFALPGGRIIVTTGLLATLASADELAAVLAHEMNHVLYRHTMELTIRASGLRSLVYVLSHDHPVAGLATSVWSVVGIMSMSRDKESQADRQAARLLADAGLEPRVLLPMLARLAPSEARPAEAARHAADKLSDSLRSHPQIAERIADVEAAIAGLSSAAAPQPLDVDYGALLEAVQALEASSPAEFAR